MRTGDEQFLSKYVNGIGVKMTLRWSKEEKDKLKVRVRRKIAAAFQSYKDRTGKDIWAIREKLYQKKKSLQSLMLSNPYLITDIGSIGQSVSEDGVSTSPDQNVFKLLNKFATIVLISANHYRSYKMQSEIEDDLKAAHQTLNSRKTSG